MLIEKELEKKIIDELSKALNEDAVEIVGSRQESAIGSVKGENDQKKKAVIAVAIAYRKHDEFTLPMLTIDGSIAITTRAEMDCTGELHEQLLDKITELLTEWHRCGTVMSDVLSNDKFFAGEFKMNGGLGKTYNKDMSVWIEALNFSIRGSEIFNDDFNNN